MLKLLLPLLSLIAVPTFAKTLVVHAEFSVSCEYCSDEINDDDLIDEGWTVSEDDYGDKIYTLDITLDESELPLVKNVGDAELSIGKSGLINAHMSVGDADADAGGSLQWPVVNNEWLEIGAPLILKVGGGEHASGYFNFDATVSVEVKN